MSAPRLQPIRRFELWPSLLEAAIVERRGRKFKWGAQDCCLFAADLVHAMTGIDLAAEWRGKYRSAVGAGKFLRAAGGLEKLIARLAQKRGLTPLEGIQWAQRGDLVLIGENIATPGGLPALGICTGSNVAAAGPAGVVFVPLARGVRAWRIG